MADQQQKPYKQRSRVKEYVIGTIALLVTLALCVAVIFYWDYLEQVKHYGYIGVFIISIFAGVTIIVPVPSIVVVFTLGSVLHPAIVGAVAGLGEATGQSEPRASTVPALSRTRKA